MEEQAPGADLDSEFFTFWVCPQPRTDPSRQGDLHAAVELCFALSQVNQDVAVDVGRFESVLRFALLRAAGDASAKPPEGCYGEDVREADGGGEHHQ